MLPELFGVILLYYSWEESDSPVISSPLPFLNIFFAFRLVGGSEFLIPDKCIVPPSRIKHVYNR